MRIQLARPDQAILGPETYNQIYTMHGMTMIFWYASRRGLNTTPSGVNV
jgi:cytochrome c oxidase subunit 1/cytochrome c oxidase subunit I+III